MSPMDHTKDPILPYASEPFGLYQPLIGWQSQLQHERVSVAIANRVNEASRLIHQPGKASSDTIRIKHADVTDRTGTKIGAAIAAHINNEGIESLAGFVGGHDGLSFSQKLAHLATNHAEPRVPAGSIAAPMLTPSEGDSKDSDQDTATAAVLDQLASRSPDAIKALFRPAVTGLSRTLASAAFLGEASIAQSAFLSPIGLLHLFREYFFEIGSFMGPPVGHVWISPGGSLELIESNTRKTLTDLTTEVSTQTTTNSETSTTDKDELSDAVKSDNANDTKLGASMTAGGGMGVFHASASGSFSMSESKKQAQEQTHKKMREQSSKLSSEVRQNFKTTFRTVTEQTDTSSRRYVLQNKTEKLVSYELSRKMRKVAVQVQDLGRRLCWQLYVDNPGTMQNGSPLALGEFVHATAAALDPNLKKPDTIPYPERQTTQFSAAFPFLHSHGADSGAEDTYKTSPNDKTKGVFEPDIGKTNIIEFQLKFQCPPTPAGFDLVQVTALNFHGAQVQWDPNLAVDTATASFTILLTQANFGGKPQLPFDVTLVYDPNAATKTSIDAQNRATQIPYTDQLAAAKEQQFFDTLRTHLKLSSKIQARPSDDLREEERNIICRALVNQLYGRHDGWTDAEYHIASEMIRYFFDVDSMLYFVAQDWWRPRTQQLVSFGQQGELQTTMIANQSPSYRVNLGGMGTTVTFPPGARPYYMITEETAPAPMGSSLGWLIQLDGDARRNSFLNSPWVKAVVPIIPGREHDAIKFLRRPEVADSDGLSKPYPFDPDVDPQEYQNKTMEEVLLLMAQQIKKEYDESVTPTPLDPESSTSRAVLPTETVFASGYDPLQGGLNFNHGAFKVFSEWMEIMPTDQVVATEYSTEGL